jgi:hypothetical protein
MTDFKEFKKKFLNKKELIISDKIIEKVKFIKNIIDNDLYKKNEKPSTSSIYVSSFNCKFKTEDIKKKKITSILNKISIDNIDKLLSKIEITEPFQDDINIIIKFINNNRLNINLYIKILNLFPISLIINTIDNIYNDNTNYWLIPNIYYDNNIYSNECNYDIYCEFIKWKNYSLSLSQLFLYYKSDEFNKNIVNSIISLINIDSNKSDRLILDSSIENLNIFKKIINIDTIKDIIKFENLPSSSKFKLLEIIEKNDI